MVQQQGTYPVSVSGELSEPPARGWWLLKWLLGIPHYIILAGLWVAFAVVTIIAFFAILFTEKYPKSLFNFNLGVIKWTWRGGFYSYEALGTDRYPPFKLGDADYPASLDVPYPEKLSRKLVLVKWWLLVLPHCVIVSFFQGGWWQSWFGLVHVVAIFASVVVLFTGKYPEDMFKLVVGMNRWSKRVLVYAALMTDEYPPFRLWD